MTTHDKISIGRGERMKEIEANKKAWGLLAKDHYAHYKRRLEEASFLINEHITQELGDLKDKTLIHLQCNIGADTIALARMGLSKVTGVDLAGENILYANQLKDDFGMDNVSFIESDILKLTEIHHESYDIVFTSEGVLGWLPDLNAWAKIVKRMLKPDGFFYVYDSHPFFHMFDEDQLGDGIFDFKYPYFSADADLSYDIGGYASEVKHAPNYWWNHTMSDIINALIQAGLTIEYLHEFDTLFWANHGMVEVGNGLYQYSTIKQRMPLSYSIKATIKKK
jgi:SAM-dependent methyltransferase